MELLTLFTIDLSSQSDDSLIQYYYDSNVRLWQVYSSIILLVGTLGNVMSIVVLSRKRMRRSNATLYRIVLAVFDLLVLCTSLLYKWVKNNFEVDLYEKGAAFCKLQKWLGFTFTDTSVWILVAFTFNRLTSVFLHHQVKSFHTRKISFITIAVIVVVLLGINFHFLFTKGWFYVQEAGKMLCSTRPGYKFFINIIWPWIDLCVFSFVPLAIISVSNATIIAKMLEDHRRLRHVHPQAVATRGGDWRLSVHQDSERKKLSSMTRMLLVLNTVLLITTLPVTMFFIAKPYIPDNTRLDSVKNKMISSVLILLMFTNNAVNFLLYCIFDSRFREELRDTFRKHSGRDRAMEGTTDTTRERRETTTTVRIVLPAAPTGPACG